MIAETVSIGTELTLGFTVDTNASWLASRLAELGAPVTRHTTVADDTGAIHDAVLSAAGRAAIVIVNGGLGPTEDDRTREALARAMNVSLVEDAASLEELRSFFKRLGRPLLPGNERQAWIPKGATALANLWGTAPGIRARLDGAMVYVLPGVPKEMFAMFDYHVRPELAAIPGRAGTLAAITVNCFGATESAIGLRIAERMAVGREPTVGITAEEAVIRVRVMARAADEANAVAAAEAEANEIREILGRVVFGADGQTLADAVAGLLMAREFTVATAESCTGGWLGKVLTDVPGSSRYYLGGFVTYSNAAKVSQLGIPIELIDEHGAVSAEVAAAMACGCRRVMGSDVALSITGVAGPSGGTVNKPVGLVYAGLSDRRGSEVQRCVFGEHLDRSSIRERSWKTALNMLRLRLHSD